MLDRKENGTDEEEQSDWEGKESDWDWVSLSSRRQEELEKKGTYAEALNNRNHEILLEDLQSVYTYLASLYQEDRYVQVGWSGSIDSNVLGQLYELVRRFYELEPGVRETVQTELAGSADEDTARIWMLDFPMATPAEVKGFVLSYVYGFPDRRVFEDEFTDMGIVEVLTCSKFGRFFDYVEVPVVQYIAREEDYQAINRWEQFRLTRRIDNSLKEDLVFMNLGPRGNFLRWLLAKYRQEIGDGLLDVRPAVKDKEEALWHFREYLRIRTGFPKSMTHFLVALRVESLARSTTRCETLGVRELVARKAEKLPLDDVEGEFELSREEWGKIQQQCNAEIAVSFHRETVELLRVLRITPTSSPFRFNGTFTLADLEEHVPCEAGSPYVSFPPSSSDSNYSIPSCEFNRIENSTALGLFSDAADYLLGRIARTFPREGEGCDQGLDYNTTLRIVQGVLQRLDVVSEFEDPTYGLLITNLTERVFLNESSPVCVDSMLSKERRILGLREFLTTKYAGEVTRDWHSDRLKTPTAVYEGFLTYTNEDLLMFHDSVAIDRRQQSGLVLFSQRSYSGVALQLMSRRVNAGLKSVLEEEMAGFCPLQTLFSNTSAFEQFRWSWSQLVNLEGDFPLCDSPFSPDPVILEWYRIWTAYGMGNNLVLGLMFSLIPTLAFLLTKVIQLVLQKPWHKEQVKPIDDEDREYFKWYSKTERNIVIFRVLPYETFCCFVVNYLTALMALSFNYSYMNWPVFLIYCLCFRALVSTIVDVGLGKFLLYFCTLFFPNSWYLRLKPPITFDYENHTTFQVWTRPETTTNGSSMPTICVSPELGIPAKSEDLPIVRIRIDSRTPSPSPLTRGVQKRASGSPTSAVFIDGRRDSGRLIQLRSLSGAKNIKDAKLNREEIEENKERGDDDKGKEKSNPVVRIIRRCGSSPKRFLSNSPLRKISPRRIRFNRNSKEDALRYLAQEQSETLLGSEENGEEEEEKLRERVEEEEKEERGDDDKGKEKEKPYPMIGNGPSQRKCVSYSPLREGLPRCTRNSPSERVGETLLGPEEEEKLEEEENEEDDSEVFITPIQEDGSESNSSDTSPEDPVRDDQSMIVLNPLRPASDDQLVTVLRKCVDSLWGVPSSNMVTVLILQAVGNDKDVFCRYEDIIRKEIFNNPSLPQHVKDRMMVMHMKGVAKPHNMHKVMRWFCMDPEEHDDATPNWIFGMRSDDLLPSSLKDESKIRVVDDLAFVGLNFDSPGANSGILISPRSLDNWRRLRNEDQPGKTILSNMLVLDSDNFVNVTCLLRMIATMDDNYLVYQPRIHFFNREEALFSYAKDYSNQHLGNMANIATTCVTGGVRTFGKYYARYKRYALEEFQYSSDIQIKPEYEFWWTFTVDLMSLSALAYLLTTLDSFWWIFVPFGPVCLIFTMILTVTASVVKVSPKRNRFQNLLGGLHYFFIQSEDARHGGPFGRAAFTMEEVIYEATPASFLDECLREYSKWMVKFDLRDYVILHTPSMWVMCNLWMAFLMSAAVTVAWLIFLVIAVVLQWIWFAIFCGCLFSVLFGFLSCFIYSTIIIANPEKVKKLKDSRMTELPARAAYAELLVVRGVFGEAVWLVQVVAGLAALSIPGVLEVAFPYMAEVLLIVIVALLVQMKFTAAIITRIHHIIRPPYTGEWVVVHEYDGENWNRPTEKYWRIVHQPRWKMFCKLIVGFLGHDLWLGIFEFAFSSSIFLLKLIQKPVEVIWGLIGVCLELRGLLGDAKVSGTWQSFEESDRTLSFTQYARWLNYPVLVGVTLALCTYPAHPTLLEYPYIQNLTTPTATKVVACLTVLFWGLPQIIDKWIFGVLKGVREAKEVNFAIGKMMLDGFITFTFSVTTLVAGFMNEYWRGIIPPSFLFRAYPIVISSFIFGPCIAFAVGIMWSQYFLDPESDAEASPPIVKCKTTIYLALGFGVCSFVLTTYFIYFFPLTFLPIEVTATSWVPTGDGVLPAVAPLSLSYHELVKLPWWFLVPYATLVYGTCFLGIVATGSAIVNFFAEFRKVAKVFLLLLIVKYNCCCRRKSSVENVNVEEDEENLEIVIEEEIVDPVEEEPDYIHQTIRIDPSMSDAFSDLVRCELNMGDLDISNMSLSEVWRVGYM